MGLRRVKSGSFMCPTCDEQFEASRVPESHLLCPDCPNVKLVAVEDDEDDDDENEENDDQDPEEDDGGEE